MNKSLKAYLTLLFIFHMTFVPANNSSNVQNVVCVNLQSDGIEREKNKRPRAPKKPLLVSWENNMLTFPSELANDYNVIVTNLYNGEIIASVVLPQGQTIVALPNLDEGQYLIVLTNDTCSYSGTLDIQ